jgi:cell division GTPase FtsZ
MAAEPVLCILPFSAESPRRQVAEDHVEELRQVTDSTVVLDNDALLKFGKDVKLDKAFRIMDKMAVKIIKDVTDSMGRSYMAVLADEILAYQSELGTANIGSQAVFHDADIGVAADSGITPMAFPQPSDQNLVEMGGMFQRF